MILVLIEKIELVETYDIIVMEGGYINGIGTHEELLKQKGRYYQLYTGKLELD